MMGVSNPRAHVALQRVTKTPNEILDYGFNWSNVLGSATIASMSVTVPTGITLVSQSNTTVTTAVWLSGGTAYQKYLVVTKITDTNSNEIERTLEVSIVPNK